MHPPISFLVFLRMKGMNLPFAAIRPIQIGEMEEMEEIGECYGFYFSFSSYSNTLIISPFPFYYLAKRKEEDTNMKEKEDNTMKEETILLFFLFLQRTDLRSKPV